MESPAKKTRPFAVCTRCGSFSYDIGQVNQRCYHRFNNRRCRGVFRSMLGSNDWEECTACGASGQGETGICLACAGKGWKNIRE